MSAERRGADNRRRLRTEFLQLALLEKIAVRNKKMMADGMPEGQLQIAGRAALAEKRTAVKAMCHSIDDVHNISSADGADESAPNRGVKAPSRGGAAARKRRKNATASP